MSHLVQFYTAQAQECARDANTARLPRLRETFLRSEAAWLALADRLRRCENLKASRSDEESERVVTREV